MNPPTQRRKKELQVGICWLVDGKAERYADRLTHFPQPHRRLGTVAAEQQGSP
jgi:hypothetical protein